VHPPDAYARKHEGVPYGKAEAWYVVEARPGARVFHGTARNLTPDELMKALTAGRADEVLSEVAVHAGDVIMNPPGTIHALGGGLVVYEIQQWSDITYRLYDWDRQSTGAGKRELHLRQGIDVARLRPLPRHTIRPVPIEEYGCVRTLLCVSRYFCGELIQLRAGVLATVPMRSFHILTQLEGECTVSTENATPVDLRPGMTAVVPAAAAAYELTSRGSSTILCAYVPDIEQDVIQRLRSHGVPDAEIAQLDGDPLGGDVDAALRGGG
jgi:mannose-6-phosphate isomerase